jgi:SAM-dependent methyltransferase
MPIIVTMAEAPLGADLDALIEAYDPSFPYALDNDLMMSAYPDRILQRHQPASILELGIGHGTCSAKFGAAAARHVIVEGSPAVIARFRQANPKTRSDVVTSLFENFETQERFDVVVAGFVLEHVSQPVALLQKYARFVAAGGTFYAAVPNGESMHRRLANLAGMLDDVTALGPGDVALGHVRTYTVKRLTEDLKRAGLTIATMEGLYLKPLTTGQLASLGLKRRVYEAMVELGYSYPELCAGILAGSSVR